MVYKGQSHKTVGSEKYRKNEKSFVAQDFLRNFASLHTPLGGLPLAPNYQEMKSHILPWTLALPLVLTACYKDAPLNAEADIERVYIHAPEADQVFFSLTDSVQDVLTTTNDIVVAVRSRANITAITPTFVLTAGATVQPQSGVPQDFSHGPVTYTVTSEDRQWKRHYTLTLRPTTVTTQSVINYDFEHYALERNKYYVWQEPQSDGTLQSLWASGNYGFSVPMGSAKPMDYPTYPVEQGHTGAAVGMTTRSTGAAGALLNKRIAAGNLFIGDFNFQSALINPLLATQFGKPFTAKPLQLKGWYSYTPGATFQDQSGATVEGRKDQGAIYAVLYRNVDDKGQPVVLHGDDVKTSQQVVALADLGGIAATNGWTPFEVDFLYRQEVDQALLANRGYSLAIVFSSSIEGDHFEGAIGSTLLIDDVQIIAQTEQ